jgi:DNA-binding transcriptional LysR family regulator
METDALKTVVLVAQHGSFAAAARVLNVDPSSVSRLVASTEAALGLRLFQRTTRSLTITEEGETYLRRITPLLEELDHAREEAGRLRRAPSGALRLTASVAFAHECILPHLAAFHTAYPDIAVELLPTDANLDLLANGIDLAIRLAAAPEGDLISTRLMRTRYHVCASPDYLARHGPIEAPEALAERTCLRFALPDYRTRWRFRRGEAAPFEVAVQGWIVIANALSLRQAARDGLGPALLADWLVGRDLASGRLIDLFPNHDCTATEFDTAAWALYASRSFTPQKVRVAIDFFRGKLRPK